MIDILSPLIKKFLPFAQERMGFENPPKLFLRGDASNAQNPLGKTAFYNPQEKSVTLYTTNRHPKDVMRSLSHELVHHAQNCRGDFNGVGEMGEGYAQNDEHLREMEREAYEVGNMCFRDWEDGIKNTIYYEHLQKGENKMSTKDWKNKEITQLLSEAWGFKFNTLEEFNDFNEGADKNDGLEPDGDDTSYGHMKEDEEGAVNEEDTVTEDEDLQETGAKDTGASKGDDSKTHKGEEDYTTKKGEKLKDTEDDGARGEKKGDEADVNESTEITEDDTAEEITEDSGWDEKEHDEHNAWNDEDHIEAIEKHLHALKRDRDYEEDHESLEENDDAEAIEEQVDPLREAIKAVLLKHLKG